MKDSKNLLNAILHSTQTGQDTIRTLAGYAISPALRALLESQLRELEHMEFAAGEIASRRGWELKETEPAMRTLTRLLSGRNLRRGNPDPVIALRFLQKNRLDAARCRKAMEGLSDEDLPVLHLLGRLSDCQRECIRRCEGFCQNF